VKSNLKSIARSALLAAGLLGAGAVLAHGNGWGNGWSREHDDDRYYDRDDAGYYSRDVRVVRPQFEGMAYARVIDVDPIVHRVAYSNPQRECWNEEREVYPQRGFDQQTAAPTIVGAVVGSVIGHQFGSGHSRDLGTVAGAVIGAAVGHDAAVRAGGAEVRSVQRCAVRDYPQYEERVAGYRVTYVYCGREYTTVMPYDPGERVRVRVDTNVVVTP